MITMIGLAVGIDYSLFIVSRYREERKKGFAEARGDRRARRRRRAGGVLQRDDRRARAARHAHHPGHDLPQPRPAARSSSTLAAIAASMTLLPAILGLLGDRINWPRLSQACRGWTPRTTPRAGSGTGSPARVMAQPVVFLVASVLILGTLGCVLLPAPPGDVPEREPAAGGVPVEAGVPHARAGVRLRRADRPGADRDHGRRRRPRRSQAAHRASSSSGDRRRRRPSRTRPSRRQSEDGSALAGLGVLRGRPAHRRRVPGRSATCATRSCPRRSRASRASTVLVGGNTGVLHATS